MLMLRFRFLTRLCSHRRRRPGQFCGEHAAIRMIFSCWKPLLREHRTSFHPTLESSGSERLIRSRGGFCWLKLERKCDALLMRQFCRVSPPSQSHRLSGRIAEARAARRAQSAANSRHLQLQLVAPPQPTIAFLPPRPFASSTFQNASGAT